MPNEPTSEERQRRAFELLRNQARTAHAEGDGLQVGLLCETALHEIGRLVAAGRLELSLSEIQWTFIFPFYWLLHNHIAHTTLETLKKVPLRGHNDHNILPILQCYGFLAQNPLLSADNTFQQLQSIPPAGFGADMLPETAELATHLIELAWYHLVTDNRWAELVRLWTDAGPSWLIAILKPLEQRLNVQTRLTVPDAHHAPYADTSASELRRISDLAELWLLHLHGRRELLLTRIREISSRLNSDAYQWRLMADFWHINSGVIPDQGDSQSVWLARRRRMSADFPILIFHDRRELRIGEHLEELYRRREVGSASQRWEALQLAMLHELASLRIWDFGMWREAVRAQSEILLEASQWKETHPSLAVLGLSNAVRSISLRSPKKDYLSRTAVSRIEFADDELLLNLATDILSVYPKQKHNAVELLDAIADLFPQQLWSQLAKWTIDYAEVSHDQNRSSGWKLNPLEHLTPVLPLVPTNAEFWIILQPEVLRISRIPHCWHDDDARHLLYSWLSWAPFGLVREIGNAMIAVPSPNASEAIVRAELLIDVEMQRSDLKYLFTEQLISGAKPIQERFQLSQRLNAPDSDILAIELRERITHLIRDALNRAMPPSEEQTCSFGPFPIGINLVTTWRDEDIPLLEELILCIDSPNVWQSWIPWLLNTVQLLVANGPPSFLDLIRPHLKRWINRMPSGRNVASPTGGAFSIMQISGLDFGDIDEALGWLAFQLLHKRAANVYTDVLNWIRHTLPLGELKSIPIAFYSAIVLASRMPPKRALPIFSIIELILFNLRWQINEAPKATRCLTSCLRYLSNVAGSPSSGMIDWSSPFGVASQNTLIEIMQKYIPAFASAPNVGLRAAVASLLCSLNQWSSFPESFKLLLDRLKNDHRARVRLAATGGWKARRELCERER